MRFSIKIDNRDGGACANTAIRPRRKRYLWLITSAFLTTGTIASISSPAHSPIFASPSSITTPLSENPTTRLAAADSLAQAEYSEASSATESTLDVSRIALGKRLLGGLRPDEALQALAANDTTPEDRSGYEVRLTRVAGIIDRSLFDDGQGAGLSDRLIMELAEIFGWDIDFVVDLRRGDSFAVLYEEKYWQGQKVADGDILAAEFINQGREFRAIGFRTDNGRMQYYSPDGFVLQRAFLRTPVKFSRVSSLFSNSRYHPILKTWRAHHGVDYDAPVGTPVRATASGRITALGWNGGYGNMVAIRHAGPYSTLYAHLSRYRAGLRAGQTVEQGEIIGYVGRTGLATAPHLHYELQVNGVHRDPLTFELPSSARAQISADVRQLFQKNALLWSAKLNVGIGSLVASTTTATQK